MGRWFKRTVALGGLVLIVLGVYGMHIWTSPEIVRQIVLEHLQRMFPDCRIEIGSAEFRLLKGVQINQVRIIQNDDSAAKLLEIPFLLAETDKLGLIHGEVVIKKLTALGPQVFIRRDSDQNWNIDRLLRESKPKAQIPAIVMINGSIIIEDHYEARLPLRIDLDKMTFSMIPLDSNELIIKCNATSSLCKTIEVEAVYLQDTKRMQGTISVSGIAIGQVVKRLGNHHQWRMFSDEIKDCDGQGNLKIKFDHRSVVQNVKDSSSNLSYDVVFAIKQGRLKHERLFEPITDIDLSIRVRNERLIIEELNAKLGITEFQIQNTVVNFEQVIRGEYEFIQKRDLIDNLSITVRHLALTEKLIEYLPIELKRIDELFHPRGLVTFNIELRREGKEIRRHIQLIPEDIAIVCKEYFDYPVEGVRGIISIDANTNSKLKYSIDLLGYGARQPIIIQGNVTGHPVEKLELSISGDNIPINETLIKALPSEYAALARSFHSRGYADFKAQINIIDEGTRLKSKYSIYFHECSVKYEVFPYPLENVSGELQINSEIELSNGEQQTDQRGLDSHQRKHNWTFSNFQGSNNGGIVRLSGQNQSTSDGDQLFIDIQGARINMDSELRQALDKLGLDSTWDLLCPTGRIEFKATIVKPPRNPSTTPVKQMEEQTGIRDLALKLSFAGFQSKPTFFPYELHDIKGSLMYYGGNISIGPVQACHGVTRIEVGHGELILASKLNNWLVLRNLIVQELRIDKDLLYALPTELRRVLDAIKLQGDIQLQLHELVVSQTTSDFNLDRKTDQMSHELASPQIYWQATINLANSTATIGIDCSQINGILSIRGEWLGSQLGNVKGSLAIDELMIYRQLLTHMQIDFSIISTRPDILQIESIFGRIYGGDLIGQGQISLGNLHGYHLAITALQLRLEEFARINRLGDDVELSGLATIQLSISGRSEPNLNTDDPVEVIIDGKFDLPSGKLAKLPLLLDLLKVLNLRSPDRTAFEEAHAVFRIRRRNIIFSQVDLIGSAISLGGSGIVSLDSQQARFEFFAIWSRLLQILPNVVRDLPTALSQQLLKIEATGTFPHQLEFRREAVPMITEPLRQFLSRFQHRN